MPIGHDAYWPFSMLGFVVGMVKGDAPLPLVLGDLSRRDLISGERFGRGKVVNSYITLMVRPRA